MGELWSATHLGLGTEVVIKFISAELSGSPGAAERFAREAAAAAQVSSPHVVKILDYGASADGAPFIVMEKLEGRDLAAYLGARGSLPPDSVARVVRQLAKALTKAHAARIVHRDVKPANVFLCEAEGELFVKLLDFGVAKTDRPEHAAATMSGVSVGTPGYMSPEQIIAAKTLDFRADLWSLGVLAFHCLTGRKPFDGETAGAVLLAIHTLPLPKLSEGAPSLPPAVDAWFERACAREPAERFTSATELANALSSALGVSVEPLVPDAEETPLAQPLPTLSDFAPAEDGSLVQSTTTHAPQTLPRSSRSTFLATALAAIVAGGFVYAGRAVHVPDSPQGAPVVHDDVPLPPPLLPPTIPVAVPFVPASAPQVPEAPRSVPARETRPRARRTVSAPTAGSPEAAASSPAASASVTSALSPSVTGSAEADTSRLYVMPDARR